MSRPLFEIAKEIAANWQTPTPQAKPYLKGMYYLLGMDDIVADLDASTTVRLFLLYAKTWTGPIATRIKAELQEMRTQKAPTNEQLFAAHVFPSIDDSIAHCDLCDAALGTPGKFVEAYTHWKEKKRMCMHCNYFLSSGLDSGDGALFLSHDGKWRHLHGAAKWIEPKQSAATSPIVNGAEPLPRPKLRYRLKFLGKKVVRKCASIVRRLVGRSA